MESWRELPSGINNWPEDIDYIMFVDENNSAGIKHLLKMIKKGKQIPLEERFFTVTGCVLARSNYPSIKDNFLEIKHKHWENGYFHYLKDNKTKRVCFHSSEIRNKRGPFCDDIIDHNLFIEELTYFITNTPMVIFSATIDKEALINKYPNPEHPYNLCLDFLLERFGKFFLRRKNSKGIIHIEARGAKEDKELLRHLVQKLDNGTRWATTEELSCIKGVFFNTKWHAGKKDLASFIGLELADLVSYPIHKFCRHGIKDPAFEILESKFYSYPRHYGKGLKIFPL